MTPLPRSLCIPLTLAAGLFATDRLSAQNRTITGNIAITGNASVSADLNVGGSIDQEGNRFTLGNESGGYGLGQFYSATDGDAVRWRARRVAAWLWEVERAGVAIPMMRLDGTNRLVLYHGGQSAVALNPARQSLSLGDAALTGSGTSLVTSGGLFVSGTASAPNLALTSGNITGGPSGLTLSAGGLDQNIALTTSGSGNVIINGNLAIGVRAPTARLSVGDADQALNILTNRRLIGVWPPVVEPSTMTLQSSGKSSGAIAFANGNTESMRIAPSGNVGVGTANPASRLHVAGPAPALRLQDTATNGGQHTVGARGSALMFNADAENAAANSRAITFSFFGLEQARIHTNGNVGIGTPNPSHKLTVTGSISIERPGIANLNVGKENLALPFGSSVRFATMSNNDTLPVLSLGNYDGQPHTLRIGTDLALSQIVFRTGDSAASQNQVGPRLVIAGSGNVGIGTATPLSTLDVAGTGSFAGNLRLAAGTARQAPLSFQTGSLLATPTSGAVEFDGANLYVTSNAPTPARQKLAYAATTLAGYGIKDPVVTTSTSYADPAWITSLGAGKLTGTLPGSRLPAFTGDVTSNAGSANLTLAPSGVAVGTYSKVAVDAKGRVTAGASLGTTDVTGALGYVPVNRAGDSLSGPLAATGFTAHGGTITGGAGGLTVAAGGTGQSLTLETSGGDLRFATNGIEHARLTANGRLGVGTASPEQSLEVVGNMTVSETLLAGKSVNAPAVVVGAGGITSPDNQNVVVSPAGTGVTVLKGVVLTVPQGDLAMGEFTAGPNPNNL